MGEEGTSDDAETGDGEATRPEAGADEDGMPNEYADTEQEELETAYHAETPVPSAAHTAEAADDQVERDTGDPTIADPSIPRPLPFLFRQLKEPPRPSRALRPRTQVRPPSPSPCPTRLAPLTMPTTPKPPRRRCSCSVE
ncbi:hypothetical protein [Streptomyces virginiae]|uniref:hypothetical protein n=1 Tax=Streptomyces virginiae TaxID=1961 RepID=UPI00366151AE